MNSIKFYLEIILAIDLLFSVIKFFLVYNWIKLDRIVFAPNLFK